MREVEHDELGLALRRAARFFGDGGLCDRYERMNDHLVQFGELSEYLADTVPGLTQEIVRRRFLSSVKHGAFGRHGVRQTIANLIDLDGRSVYPARMYGLRPSYLRVEACPELMRARRSVWVLWLEAQRWRVPPEFKTSILIDQKDACVDEEMTSDVSSPSNEKDAGGAGAEMDGHPEENASPSPAILERETSQVHKGGRPNELKKAFFAWLDQTDVTGLSYSNLAHLYKNAGGKGDEEYLRKSAPEWRKRRPTSQ